MELGQINCQQDAERRPEQHREAGQEVGGPPDGRGRGFMAGLRHLIRRLLLFKAGLGPGGGELLPGQLPVDGLFDDVLFFRRGGMVSQGDASFLVSRETRSDLRS